MNRDTLASLLEVESLTEFVSGLQNANLGQCDAADVASLARKLGELAAEPEFRIALVGNFTLDFLPPWIALTAAQEGLVVECYVSPFDQAFQELLDGTSGLHRFRPHLTLLAMDPTIGDANAGELADQILEWVALALQDLSGTVLAANLPRRGRPADGIADANTPDGEAEAFLDANLRILRGLRDESRAHIFDVERLALTAGLDCVRDTRMRFLAKAMWSEQFLPRVADELVRFALAVLGRTRKCLVLDLDNTLWGGVVGEEGAEGVRIGRNDPESEAFLAFQKQIKQFAKRGILLAACSKNNAADVAEVFSKRTEMPLAWDDFAAAEVNWDPKSVNLERIARKLNIGTDSLVFVDDNPAECELVRQMLPEVHTVQLPSDPAAFVGALEGVRGLEKLRILDADRAKGQHYAEQAQREDVKRTYPDLRSYLESLETELSFRPAESADLDRVHQLFTKTNQFNVTTIRYSIDDVGELHAGPTTDLLVAEVWDRFGELGKVGLALVRRENDIAVLDSFVLSCRAMGRGVETAMMNEIKKRYLSDGSYERMIAAFRPTAKNAPAATFFADQGFEVQSETEDGSIEYDLGRGESTLAECDWIRIRLEDQ